MMKKMAYWHNFQDIQLLQKSLEQGFVSLGSSDTILGFMAPLTKEGFLALNTIKERYEKPYIVLLSSLEEAAELSDQIKNNPRLYSFLKQCWPGPVTIVVKANKELLDFMHAFNGTIALRVPDHKGLQHLLRNIPGIFSTSANRSNHKAPHVLEEVEEELQNKMDYIVLDKEKQHLPKPSTILDCTQETITVLREGIYPVSILEKMYGAQFRRV